MKKYIGTKIIEAEPAYRVVDAEGNGTVDLGYKVRYPDGYESFSPKGAFDDAYHPIDGMNFGLAIEVLRKGFRVRRRGWNGKGIFIELQTPDAYSRDLRINENSERGSEQMFRYKKSVPVSYERQGYIYFASRLYRELTEEQQRKLLNLCLQCGGEHYQALFEFVTTDAGATAVCMKHFLSRSTLERAVRRYYESFPQNL